MIIEVHKAICEECLSHDAFVMAVNGIIEGNPICPHCHNILTMKEAENDD